MANANMGLTTPFIILSDIHFHNWSAFSSINKDGVNERLQHQLDTFATYMETLLAAGGNCCVITGDVFHTRGKLAPSIINPVYTLFEEYTARGIKYFIIPGNHDLETKETTQLGNGLHFLSKIEGVTVFTEVTQVGDYIFMPWIDHKETFINTVDGLDAKGKVLFCHVGIDGVLDGIQGKVGKAVLNKGFDAVFAGDYHNHKHLGDNIYSVGHMCHHSFSDVGSKAGAILYRGKDDITFLENKVGTFCNHYDDVDVHSHYVRIKDVFLTEEEAKQLKQELLDNGAWGVTDNSSRVVAKSERTTRTVDPTQELNVMLHNYISTIYSDKATLVKERIKDYLDVQM